MKTVFTVNSTGTAAPILSYPDDFNDSTLQRIVSNLGDITDLSYVDIYSMVVDTISACNLNPVEANLTKLLIERVMNFASIRNGVKLFTSEEIHSEVKVVRTTVTNRRTWWGNDQVLMLPKIPKQQSFNVNCAITGIPFMEALFNNASAYAPMCADRVLRARAVKCDRGMVEFLNEEFSDTDRDSAGCRTITSNFADAFDDLSSLNDFYPKVINSFPKSTLEVLESSSAFIPSLYHYSINVAVDNSQTLV